MSIISCRTVKVDFKRNSKESWHSWSHVMVVENHSCFSQTPQNICKRWRASRGMFDSSPGFTICTLQQTQLLTQQVDMYSEPNIFTVIHNQSLLHMSISIFLLTVRYGESTLHIFVYLRFFIMCFYFKMS